MQNCTEIIENTKVWYTIFFTGFDIMLHGQLLTNFIIFPITIYWSQPPSKISHNRNNIIIQRIAKQHLANEEHFLSFW